MLTKLGSLTGKLNEMKAQYEEDALVTAIDFKSPPVLPSGHSPRRDLVIKKINALGMQWPFNNPPPLDIHDYQQVKTEVSQDMLDVNGKKIITSARRHKRNGHKHRRSQINIKEQISIYS